MSDKTRRFISDEDLALIWQRKEAILNSAPFEKKTLDRLHHISFLFGDDERHVNLDLKEASEIYRDISEALVISKNMDAAVEAHIQIQLGKLLVMIQDHVNFYNKNIKSAYEKRISFDEASRNVFGSEISRSDRFKLKNVARIPKVEMYSFLGISKLKQIEPVTREIDSEDPIGDLLGSYGYEFKLENEDDFSFAGSIVIKAANKIKLEKNGVFADEYDIDILTKNHGSLSNKQVKMVAASVNRGNPISLAVESSIKKQSTKVTQVDISPSYNKFEETCLRLSDMIEDILDDEYLPDYDGSSTATMLKVLVELQNDLICAWSNKGKMHWTTFAKEVD
ncbi:hypothetical protein [Oceanidesulfovibrio marinus]|uniref:Uncharacterized protein n=1 Tax=Oceanidesulfovibrio marinus TaxID=370038 RepID=A0A6P1ZFU0_9BACT|nr:hypothetical protein [Oceanidesulfovibrio marinus]TVM33672.1 hypothetical protein DQK91_10615 [Oceanidesulfovibrio marinus]